MLFFPLIVMCILAVVSVALTAMFAPDGSSNHALEERLARRAEDRAVHAAPEPATSVPALA